MSPIEIIIASIGGSAALVAVLGWLAKSLVSSLLEKDIQKYKIELEREKESELEKMRCQLSQLTNEHKIRFERLHERRDEVIATLYSKIVEFYRNVDNFVDLIFLLGEAAIEKEEVALFDAVDSLKVYAEKNRIYFSEELCARLDALYNTADEPTVLLRLAVENPDAAKDKSIVLEAWKAAREKIDGEVQEIRKEIESDFRSLLGVANERGGT